MRTLGDSFEMLEQARETPRETACAPDLAVASVLLNARPALVFSVRAVAYFLRT